MPQGCLSIAPVVVLKKSRSEDRQMSKKFLPCRQNPAASSIAVPDIRSHRLPADFRSAIKISGRCRWIFMGLKADRSGTSHGAWLGWDSSRLLHKSSFQYRCRASRALYPVLPYDWLQRFSVKPLSATIFAAPL